MTSGSDTRESTLEIRVRALERKAKEDGLLIRQLQDQLAAAANFLLLSRQANST
jgi:chaperonin cofactor prefoldin